MDKPIIFAIDDDAQVLNAINRDLKKNYGKKYKIVSTTSAREAIELLGDLKNGSHAVAMFVCDQRMPEMEGVEFLRQAIKLFPGAKRILLTAYSDTEAAIKAINLVQLDYYLMKPWDPPEEKLYPLLNDLLDDWQSNYVPDFKGIKLAGYQFSPESHNIKDYLASNLIPYQWFDMEKNPEAARMLERSGLTGSQLPVLFFEDGGTLSKPSLKAIAEKIGTNPQISNIVYDVIIVGAGPAGLAAAVYGSSEGLKTLLIDRKAPGGQAGTSSRIENYLGFPAGLSGADLTRRAISQAMRLGAEFLSPESVRDIREKDGYKVIVLDDGKEIVSRTVLLTTGVDYRQLNVPGIENFTGAGVYYGAAITEASACKGKEVFVVGGGNSAGQSAVYLSKFAKNVFIVIRRGDLTATMSAYLIQQIEDISNIILLPNTEIAGAEGNQSLEKITIYNIETKNSEDRVAGAMYIFIGARPYTDWLPPGILRDERGYIETGRELQRYAGFKPTWKQSREPYFLETSMTGIFAAGDNRSGAMNRIASAVGEGSMAISFVHKYLADV